jgi:tRNA threonylcarbamoyladenosine biosynthesis protein TsaB
VLLRWLDECLEELDVVQPEFLGVACVCGPGAFTGLRVGLATAGGLAMGWDVPVWGVDALLPRARSVDRERVLVALDARKERVYAAWYEGGVRVTEIEDIAPDAVECPSDGPWYMTGEGAVVYQDLWASRGGCLVDEASSPPLRGLVRDAWVRFEEGEGTSVDRLVPLYIRKPDALTLRQRGGSSGA